MTTDPMMVGSTFNEPGSGRGLLDVVRRRYLLGELRSMGLECFEPQGAFYMFPSIESTGLSSDEFCERLLHEQEIAVIPGSAFGESGEGHVRISYSYSMNHLREACSRIRKFLQTL